MSVPPDRKVQRSPWCRACISSAEYGLPITCGAVWNMLCNMVVVIGIWTCHWHSGNVAPLKSNAIKKLCWKSLSMQILRWCLTPDM